jgi:alkanesulfonate monooxygenase SsuD/methylene tetrahydromethanopterin reductase-like flavin-dependent oxidoreductase (luciferase family)
MWSDDNGPFQGSHYELAETLCSPAPVSSPRPRILIGGGGEKKTLRLVAQYADACNIFGDATVIAHKLEVLRRHCDTVGRAFDDIEVTTLVNVEDGMSSDDILVTVASLADIGVDTVVARSSHREPSKWLEDTWRRVIPELTGM